MGEEFTKMGMEWNETMNPDWGIAVKIWDEEE